MYVDRFGNLISTLTLAHLEEARSIAKYRQLFIRIGERIIEGLVASYSEGTVGQPSALINSAEAKKRGRESFLIPAAR